MSIKNIRVLNEGDRIIAFLKGDIDHYTASIIRPQIDSVIHTTAPTLLVLDFNDVNFMDSAGIGLILGRVNEMKKIDNLGSGDNVIIVNVKPFVEKLLTLAGLARLISKY